MLGRSAPMTRLPHLPPQHSALLEHVAFWWTSQLAGVKLSGVGGWKAIGNSGEGKGKVMCLDPKAQRFLALRHTLTAFPVDSSQRGSGFGAVCSCPGHSG